MSEAEKLATMVARLQSIGEDPFEDFIGEFFQHAGWDIEVTQRTKDGGVDAIGVKAGVIKQKARIQAKCYSEGNKVGQGEVDKYLKLKEHPDWHETDHAVIVTTSAFTRGAFSDAKDLNIKLLDGMGLATFIENRGLHDLIEKYAPTEPESELNEPEEYERDVRNTYYGEWSPEEMSRVFADNDLMRAIEIIDNRRVGTFRIEAMDSLLQEIQERRPNPPVELLREEPWLMNLNWSGASLLGDKTELLGSQHEPDGLADISCALELLCIQHNHEIHVLTLLPTSETIRRPHLIAMESYYDAFNLDCLDEGEEANDVYGHTIGRKVDSGRNTQSKFERLNMTKFNCANYPHLLRTSVRANRELIQAVRPFVLGSNDRETLKRIRRLNGLLMDDSSFKNNPEDTKNAES